AILSGACGEFFGSNPIWHFDGPRIFPSKTTWQKALDGQGSWDMARLRNVLSERPWHQLVADREHEVVTEGYGRGLKTVATAYSRDRTLALSYVPSTGTESRSLTVDLGKFKGPVKARWYNPTNGRFLEVERAPLANSGSSIFHAPGDNGTGTYDWLLMLEVQ